MPIRYLMCVVLLASLAPSALGQAREDEAVAGNKALAERFAHLSQLMLASRAIVPETLRQSEALLEAATRLNPEELRFARLSAEVALQLHDHDAAIAAYRAITRLDPADQVAQIRLMDLYVDRMETADQRLEYLARLRGSDTIAAEVRGHAAYLSALVRLERAERDEALKFLDDALKLNPVSPEALKKKFELAAADLPPAQRIELLLAMLKSNPAQPGVMADLALELGALGLSDLSLQWYSNALDLGQAVGRGIKPSDVAQYTAMLVITDQASNAESIIDQLINGDPGNVDIAFLNLLVQRRNGNAEKLDKAKADVQNALAIMATNLHQLLEGGEGAATTQPSTSVDVIADIKRLLEMNNLDLRAGYASLLADLAWLEVYFNENSSEAEKYLAPLRQLVPAESPILARLEGWQYLRAGRIDEAKVKLSAAAEHDPLAQLGLLRILETDPANKQLVREEAIKLFGANSSGVMGAILADALRDKIEGGPGQGIITTERHDDVRKLLEEFPQAWLDFMGKPNSIYTLKADPLKVNHAYGEPIIARITIKNNSPFDITIGEDGALRPDLWFDLQLRGLVQQGMQGVTFDRIGQRVVLKPKESISQTVRVDQGPVTALLQGNPSISIPLYFSVFTNPITLQTGIAPGPGGRRESFSRVVNRTASPLNALGAALARLAAEPPGVKMQMLELLATYSRLFLAQQDEKIQAKGTEMMNGVKRATTKEPVATVRTWASYLYARLTDAPEQRESLIKQMLASEDWTARLLGLVMIQSLDHAKWKELAQPVLDSDPDATVKKFAAAAVEFADNPASLRAEPATQPKDEQPSAASGR